MSSKDKEKKKGFWNNILNENKEKEISNSN